MTDVTIELAGVAERADNGPDLDMLRQVIRFMAPRLVGMDVETLCGEVYDAKSAQLPRWLP